MFTLSEADLTAIQLDYTASIRTDQYGNQFRYRAEAYFSTGYPVRTAWDVFLLVNPPPQPQAKR
jgi:hypothetical protein